MTVKTTLPPNKSATKSSPSSAKQRDARSGPAELAATWAEARRAYPIYAALAKQFSFLPPPYPEGDLPPARPTRDVFDRDLAWLEEMDQQIKAFQIRQLPPAKLNAQEEGLRAFIQRHLRKTEKTNAERDKIDFLLVQYFALCAPESMFHEEISLTDVASVLKPVLVQVDTTALDWCRPLENILSTIQKGSSLRDVLDTGLLEQGRLLKETSGPMFYDPAALLTFARFNFLVRRAFIRLMHADQTAILKDLGDLEKAGVRNVDCRRAGFSAAESTGTLRQYAEDWRPLYHKDYSENAVTRSFEKLLALRTDLEDALIKLHPPAPAEKTAADSAKSTATKSAASADASKAAPPKSSAAAKSSTASEEASASLAEMENCLEAIWEQLIAAPPSRGRSMSTVVLQDTKVLLSSWEVAAFVAEGGQDSEDLRRAVTARAMIAVAMDARKRSGESASLVAAIEHARSEVSYFQGRVEAAKRSKNTEAAVNLGISTKRLLSVIEEADKLQP